jgi:outer membrane protein
MIHLRKCRAALLVAAAALLAALAAPAAIASDVTDIGYIDQADLANLPVFVNANRQLAAYKAQLDGQFAAAMRNAKTGADRQRLAMQFQQKLSDKQQEIIGPLFERAQLAIATVSAARNLSVVVDKRIVIYGGQDITKDVETLFNSPQAIAPPAATPPPSEIGYVDQNVLDSVPKVKAANDQMASFATEQREYYSAKIAQAKTDADRKQLYQAYNKALSKKQEQLLKPLVDETKAATADVARKKHLLLVLDRGDVIYGGTDITPDVQNELNT